MVKKHTLGPWEAVDGRVVKDGKAIATAWMTQKGSDLTNDHGWDRSVESWLEYRERTRDARKHEEDVRMLNAKLIASAPELLEQCEKMIEVIERDFDLMDDDSLTVSFLTRHHYMKEAIKKATSW
jgi:hypothetical protein